MASIDLSRHATNFAKHYDGSRLAQGQVLSDDDFNDGARIAHEDMRRTRVDVIGPAGTPDGGFAIAPAAPSVVNGRCTFTIKAGSFYLGGLRLTLEADELFHLQRDWLQQAAADRPLPPPPGQTRFDAVYLECYQVPVSACEDGELNEPAFGGAPPALRVRTVRRVRVETDVGADDCKAAWTTVKTRWASLGTIAADAELKPNATLQVTYGGADTPADLCAPGVVAGFLGAENQAIRVQTLAGNQFVWGYDNASRIYRVEVQTIGALRRKIHFLTQPRDAHSRPLAGQIVEILPWSAALANRLRPDGRLDDCEKTAEVAGHLAIVESSYNPSDQTLTLNPLPGNPVPAGFGEAWKSRADQLDILGDGPEYYFLRVWDQGQEGMGAPKSLPFMPNVAVPLGTTGLSVTFHGTQFPADLHWIVGARPETADQVIPWQFDSDAGRTPQGVRRFRTPLAIIEWTNTGGVVSAKVVDDCRPPFLPLTRIGTCCTVTVGDGSTSFGHFNTIKDALAALPLAGGEICVLAGHYLENVDLKGRTDIAIHGCGPRTIIESPLDGLGLPLGPVFDITGAQRIRITDMTIVNKGMQGGIVSTAAGSLPSDIHLADLNIWAGPRSAIELLGGRHITILRCKIAMRNQAGPWPAIYSGADDVHIEHNHILANPDLPLMDKQPTHARGGLQIGGGSERVRIIDNLIERGIGNGITLGSLIKTDPNGGDVIIFWFVDPDDPCDPCKPGDIVIIVIPGQEGGIRSAGDLYDILIERNRIFDMGLNGVGVVGFFDLTKVPILIGVHDLRIIGNVIRHCLARELAQTPPIVQLFSGFGAIALAECNRLLVRDNDLVENGASHVNPVCGVFVLIGKSLEISDNRIEENGPFLVQQAALSKTGNRSGIHIGLALPQMVDVLADNRFATAAAKINFGPGDFRRQKGVNALRVHGNVVTQPVGRSLTALALGHVSVADNTLTSRGIPRSDVLYRLVPNVLLVGLGFSNELGFTELLNVMGQSSTWLSGKDAFLPDWLKKMCEVFDKPPDNELYPGYLVPSSKVAFVDNRCALDLMGEPSGLIGGAILVAGTDDVAFGANQCELDMPQQIGAAQALLGAMSVRVFDNRFAETRRHVFYSGIIGGLLNTTTNNQSTHCLLPIGPVPNTLVKTSNTALIELFCGPICNRVD